MYLIFVSVNFRGLTENGIPVDFLFRCVDIYLLITSFYIYICLSWYTKFCNLMVQTKTIKLGIERMKMYSQIYKHMFSYI